MKTFDFVLIRVTIRGSRNF